MSYHPVPTIQEINLPAVEEIVEESTHPSKNNVMESAPVQSVMESVHSVMEAAPVHSVMEAAPVHSVMESAPVQSVMESVQHSEHHTKSRRVPAMNNDSQHCMQFPSISGFGGNEFAEI